MAASSASSSLYTATRSRRPLHVSELTAPTPAMTPLGQGSHASGATAAATSTTPLLVRSQLDELRRRRDSRSLGVTATTTTSATASSGATYNTLLAMGATQGGAIAGASPSRHHRVATDTSSRRSTATAAAATLGSTHAANLTPATRRMLFRVAGSGPLPAMPYPTATPIRPADTGAGGVGGRGVNIVVNSALPREVKKTYQATSPSLPISCASSRHLHSPPYRPWLRRRLQQQRCSHCVHRWRRCSAPCMPRLQQQPASSMQAPSCTPRTRHCGHRWRAFAMP